MLYLQCKIIDYSPSKIAQYDFMILKPLFSWYFFAI